MNRRQDAGGPCPEGTRRGARRTRARNKALLAAIPLLLVPPALLISQVPGLDSWQRSPDDMHEGPLRLDDDRFWLGLKAVHFPWKGEVRVDGFDMEYGQNFGVDFDLTADLRKAEGFFDEIEAVHAVLVGEPVYKADGRRTGFVASTLTTRFTAAGVPMEHYRGTLPVHAFGDKDGSPFEAVVDFDAAGLGIAQSPEAVRLKGRFEVPMGGEIPIGWYRPHVELFVKLKGTDKRVDLRHLGISLGPWVNDRANSIRPRIPAPQELMPSDLSEFMKDAQVLPNVRVGEPAKPRLVFTLFSDVAAHGQSGLVSVEDAGHAGVSNRSRFPTPFVLQPGTWETVPGMPAEFPSSGLAGLFQGYGSLPREVESWLDLDSGSFTATLIDPDGARIGLGTRSVARSHEGGLQLAGGPFLVDLRRTGDYQVELQGCFIDVLGRELCGGGTYAFTCALPMSFSTAVKPGTNFLVGSRFPIVMDLNPAVEATVRSEIHFVPGSDPERAVDWIDEGISTRFGYYEADPPPPRFEEPGEYRSLLSVRWYDQSGNLWLGQQSSAGVVAPAEPSGVRLHGTRTSFFEPRAEMEQLGAFERYREDFEGGSSFAEHSALSFYDHTIPYHSGDTLYVPTTYPLESVIGPSLSIEATSPELRSLMEELWLKDGPLPPYPYANRWRTLSYLPHVYKLSEDNFTYHTVEPGVLDNMPVVPFSTTGYSPYAWPEDTKLDAYVYLSVIRPGLPVLSMAYAGTFQAACWIISPNDYGYRFHSSPNGDLPEDLYRTMAGVVIRNRETGESWYDAYSSGIRILPPGAGYTAVQPPGEIPLLQMAGRDEYAFLGLNTSGVFAVGHRLLLGGTLMPPVQADVKLDVQWPSGRTWSGTRTSNRLGGMPPPMDLIMDEPGVYKVQVDIEMPKQDGTVVHGDVVGSGDGEILFFALPEDTPRVMSSPLPAMSKVTDLDRVVVPLGWSKEVQDVRLSWSVMTPGALYDEGYLDLDGQTHEFVWRPRQSQIQLPNYDTVDYSNGSPLLTDIVVFVFFFEGTVNGEPVFDATRVLMRGDVLINPDALIDPDLLRGAGPYVGDPPLPYATYPDPSYRKEVDLDGLDVRYGRDERRD